MAEFDAAEADMAQTQTRPVDADRAEEEELLESDKPVRPSRGRGHQFPSANRLATGGIVKVDSANPSDYIAEIVSRGACRKDGEDAINE
jgi:hypothetical protein